MLSLVYVSDIKIFFLKSEKQTWNYCRYDYCVISVLLECIAVCVCVISVLVY